MIIFETIANLLNENPIIFSPKTNPFFFFLKNVPLNDPPHSNFYAIPLKYEQIYLKLSTLRIHLCNTANEAFCLSNMCQNVPHLRSNTQKTSGRPTYLNQKADHLQVATEGRHVHQRVVCGCKERHIY
jgi:hypothetical protein